MSCNGTYEEMYIVEVYATLMALVFFSRRLRRYVYFLVV
jgi:hypothetical protein